MKEETKDLFWTIGIVLSMMACLIIASILI